MTVSKKIYPYEQATIELYGAILKKRSSQQPILNWLGESRVTRHRGVLRNIQGDEPLDQSFVPLKSTVQIAFDTIQNTNIQAYIDEIKNIGDKIAKKRSENFFTGLNEIFDHPNSPAVTTDFRKI